MSGRNDVVDLAKLRHAVAVATEGSFRAAAVAIPMSQPALSRSIQSLEREYHLRIFERGGSGTRLTRQGARFIARAERLLEHADATDEDLRGLSTGAGETVSFGVGPASAFTFLPEALPRLVAELDDQRVRVRVGSNSVLRDLLQAGEIEFYIGGVPRDSDNIVISNGMAFEPIATASQLKLVVREDHPLLHVALTHDEVARYPVVAGTFVRDTLAEADVLALGVRRPSIEVDDYDLLTEIVRTTDAILVTSSIFTEHRTGLGVVPLPLDVLSLRPVTYALMRLGDRELSPAAALVAAFIVDVIRSSLTDASQRPAHGA
jgi:DNA-binding transcriptional LysR family regulator